MSANNNENKILPSYFKFEITTPDETDLVLVSLTDSRTNFVVRTALPNSGKQVASIMAFAGARYSRSDLGAINLFKEIKDAQKSANEKLATIFRQYGHASVADMANLFAYVENVPQIVAWKFFYSTSLGGGQERSTRYQKFDNLFVDDLANYLPLEKRQEIPENPDYESLNIEFKSVLDTALDKYNLWVKKLTAEYTNIYKINPESKGEINALNARVFDSSRYFLPSGFSNRTSLAWITSAREWARIIGIFKTESNHELVYLAEQLEWLFAPDNVVASEIGYVPEASELIRYTSRDETRANSLTQLDSYLKQTGIINSLLENSKNSNKSHKNPIEYRDLEVKFYDNSYTATEKALAQNIITLYPNLSFKDLFQVIQSLTNSQKIEISRLLVSDYTQHKQMPTQFQTNNYTFELNQSIAEARDLNRHRAWGRFTPLLEIQTNYDDLLAEGYHLPDYLTQVEGNQTLDNLRVDFEKDLQDYYSKFQILWAKLEGTLQIPDYLLIQFLPFAHSVRTVMHGSIKELSHLSKIRSTCGCHINVRRIMFMMNKLACDSDFLLEGIRLKNAPNPARREEFVDRS